MSGIDDWYLDYAHRHELSPGYSPDDDVPDPFVPGEAPQREWTMPVRGRSRRPATRARASARSNNVPAESALGGTRTRNKTTSVKKAKAVPGEHQPRRSRSRTTRSQSAVPWRTFALNWLRSHPGASNRQWQEAIEEASYLGVTAAAVSALRASAKPARKSRRTSSPHPRRLPAPTNGAPPVRARYCDACGLAISHDGRCRC